MPSTDASKLKAKYRPPEVLLLLLMLQVSHKACQTALTSNVYSQKLSKLSDTSSQSKFLILQSDRLAEQQSEMSQPTGSRLNANDEDEDSLEAASSDLSPLVSAWKNQQQQQQQQQPATNLKKPKYFVQNNSSDNLSQLIDYSKVPGEPSVVESISTEFPNPNINNLGHEITKILKKFFLHGYDKRVRPNYSGPPALVNVSFHIIGISSVDEVQMDFTTDFYFRQKWFDPRLEFKPVGDIDELCVGAEFAEKIWLPDTFFANEKTATFHRATTENTFIRIANSGRVYRSIRLTVTCSCPMDLQYFPMDRQRCKIEIESYGYNTRDIDYRWERGDASVTLNTKIELPQFKILGFKMGQELQNLSSGDYIRLYCEIHFVRSMGYYLIQIYIPASLIVMISWVSFWLHRNATPARVALGVTTVLTMTTLMSSTNAALPKISYIKSIDVFLGTCFVMVFASLLEYASVGYIGKRIAMKRKRLQDLQQMQQHHQRICLAAASAAAAVNQNININNNNLPVGQIAQDFQSANNFNRAKSQQQSHEDMLVVLQTQAPSNDARNKHLSDQQIHPTAPNLKSIDSTNGTPKSSTFNTAEDNERRTNWNSRGTSVQAPSRTLDSLSQGQTSTPKTNDQDSSKPTNSVLKRKGKNAAKSLKASPISPTDFAKTPLLAPGATIATPTTTTFNQTSHNATTEFEVSQTHDMIRICGITPSAIDKHSRVVFPICFVCFNLMYWIIYGHISQQVEDKGPPLIPFIKG